MIYYTNINIENKYLKLFLINKYLKHIMIREHDNVFPEIQPISGINLQPVGDNVDLNNLNKKIVNSVECQQHI